MAEKKTDFDKPKGAIDAQNEMRIYMERYNKNEVSLAGKVVALQVGDAKPKLDKKTNEHILIDGVPQFWEPFRSAEIIFEGGTLNINLNRENFDLLSIGNRFMFSGLMGLNYGKIQPIFHNVVLL